MASPAATLSFEEPSPDVWRIDPLEMSPGARGGGRGEPGVLGPTSRCRWGRGPGCPGRPEEC